MSENTTNTARPVLHRDNFAGWYEDFEAYAGTKGLWRMCTGAERYPTPDDPDALTREERMDLEAYETRKSKASSEIWLGVEESLRDDIRGFKGDPKKMLETLEETHNQKAPGIRFKAYNDFLNITLRTELEPHLILSTLISDINNSLSFIRRQRPDDFTITHHDAELATMITLRALRDSENQDHRAFATQFLMKEDLNFKDVEATIRRGFQSKPTIKQEEMSLAMAAQTPGPCYLCDGPHFIRDCEKLLKAKQGLSVKEPQRSSRGRGHGRGSANTTEASNSTPPAASANRTTEFAGKASAFTSSSHRSSWLESRAATDWNTDTGASSHMTP
ncbi:hypothetical protein C8J57DRAFT_1099469, partial [Mycena rebaudengoi]